MAPASQQREIIISEVGGDKSSPSYKFEIQRRTPVIIATHFERSSEAFEESSFENTLSKKEEVINLMAELSFRIIRSLQIKSQEN